MSITIQPYEDQPRGEAYQYPPLLVNGRLVTYGSSSVSPLYNWINTRIRDASFMCEDKGMMTCVNAKSFLNNKMHKAGKELNKSEDPNTLQERAISKFLKSNQTAIYRDELRGLRVTIQRNSDNQFICLGDNKVLPHNLFDEERTSEMIRFCGFLPQGGGLDGMLIHKSDLHNHGPNYSKTILPHIRKIRSGIKSELSLHYVVTDIIIDDVTTTERMDILQRMYNKYVECFSRPVHLSIIDHYLITSREEVMSHLNRSQCCTLIRPEYSYKPGSKHWFLRLNNLNVVIMGKKEQEIIEFSNKQKEQEIATRKQREQEILEASKMQLSRLHDDIVKKQVLRPIKRVVPPKIRSVKIKEQKSSNTMSVVKSNTSINNDIKTIVPNNDMKIENDNLIIGYNKIKGILYDILMWLDYIHGKVIKTERQLTILKNVVLSIAIIMFIRAIYYSM